MIPNTSELSDKPRFDVGEAVTAGLSNATWISGRVFSIEDGRRLGPRFGGPYLGWVYEILPEGDSTRQVRVDENVVIPTCKGCGLCCLDIAAPPYSMEERTSLQTNQPAVYHDLMAVEATRELQLRVTGIDTVPCGFLDHVIRTCRHHAHRPQVCRDFEVGGISCLEFRQNAKGSVEGEEAVETLEDLMG